KRPLALGPCRPTPLRSTVALTILVLVHFLFLFIVLFLRGQAPRRDRVPLDQEALRLVLSVHVEDDAVRARGHLTRAADARAEATPATTASATTASARSGPARRSGRCAPDQVVESRLGRGGQLADLVPVDVLEHQRRFIRLLRQREIDVRPRSRVLADEPAAGAAAGWHLLPAHDRVRLVQSGLFLD